MAKHRGEIDIDGVRADWLTTIRWLAGICGEVAPTVEDHDSECAEALRFCGERLRRVADRVESDGESEHQRAREDADR